MAKEFIIFLIALLVALGLFIVDQSTGQEIPGSGFVVEKSYTAQTTSVGSGVTTDGKAIVTTSSTPEKYILFVKKLGGFSVVEIEVSSQDYFAFKTGDTLRYYERRGRWTNTVAGYSLH